MWYLRTKMSSAQLHNLRLSHIITTKHTVHIQTHRARKPALGQCRVSESCLFIRTHRGLQHIQLSTNLTQPSVWRRIRVSTTRHVSLMIMMVILFMQSFIYEIVYRMMIIGECAVSWCCSPDSWWSCFR